MNALPRWIRCLARGNARLRPLPGKGRGFGVFTNKDRRCRPLVRVSQKDVQAGLDEDVLVEDDGVIILSELGHRLAAQKGVAESQCASRHREMIEKPFLSETGHLEVQAVNARENPLHPWSQYMDPVEMEAGDRLRADYTLSTLYQRTTQSWDMTFHQDGNSPSHDSMPLAKLQAKDRVMAALSAVGTGMDRLLMAVCIHEETMGAIERRFGWGQRSGKTVLKLALRQLAEHYGMVRKAQF